MATMVDSEGNWKCFGEAREGNSRYLKTSTGGLRVLRGCCQLDRRDNSFTAGSRLKFPTKYYGLAQSAILVFHEMEHGRKRSIWASMIKALR